MSRMTLCAANSDLSMAAKKKRRFPKNSARSHVRRALESLSKSLESEYACGSILSEADVQVVVVEHLKKCLRQHDDRWVIGTNHMLGRYRPDVLCYYTDGYYENVLKGGGAGLVAVVEIKWASTLKKDLRKLVKVGRKFDILTWMVYVDHFDPDIHRRYAQRQIEREKDIFIWANRLKGMAGHTIVKCGGISGPKHHVDRINALRKFFWIND